MNGPPPEDSLTSNAIEFHCEEVEGGKKKRRKLLRIVGESDKISYESKEVSTEDAEKHNLHNYYIGILLYYRMSRVYFVSFVCLLLLYSPTGVFNNESKQLQVFALPHIYDLKQTVKSFTPKVPNDELAGISESEKRKILTQCRGTNDQNHNASFSCSLCFLFSIRIEDKEETAECLRG
jgi:hypothetical protein